MKAIFQSVSQVVFFLIALAATGTFIYSVATGKTTFENKDFMLLAGMTFGYYFGAKTSDVAPMSGAK